MHLERIANQYIDLWNEKDPLKRRAALEDVLRDDCSYTDPLADVKGRDAIDAVIGAVQARFDGLAFSLRGRVDEHHGVARFVWEARAGAGEPLVVGFDVITTEGGKIRQVVGFLDKAPMG